MPKRNVDDFMVSETGNWNVAADYSRLKIMKYLYYSDEYSDIAMFGTSDLFEELGLQGQSIDNLKILGFKRLLRCLITLIDNTSFAVKKGKDKLDKYKQDLKRIEKVLPLFYRYRHNQVKKSKELVLVNEKYDEALEKVLEIKALINEPLNKSHLIFTDKEDFDPKAFKDSMKSRMVNKG